MGSEANRQLVIKRVGDVQLSKELFSEDQKIIFQKVQVIADKNPVIDWNRNKEGHNLDFCLIEGRIEAVKNFHLKVVYMAGLSFANTGTKVQGIGKDMCAISTVKVWKEGESRVIEMTGGATIQECWGKNGRRAFHDMVARAQTRAVKAGVEAYMGFPFINLMIQDIFGNYEVTGKPEDEGVGNMKDVTEEPERIEESGEKEQDIRKTMTKTVRQIAGNIFRTMDAAYKKGIITAEEMNNKWDRIKNFYHDENGIIQEQVLINIWLKEKGA